MTLKSDTAKKLKQARKDKGMTQTELANKLGVSLRYVQHIESGERNFSMETFETFCKSIGVKPELILR